MLVMATTTVIKTDRSLEVIARVRKDFLSPVHISRRIGPVWQATPGQILQTCPKLKPLSGQLCWLSAREAHSAPVSVGLSLRYPGACVQVGTHPRTTGWRSLQTQLPRFPSSQAEPISPPRIGVS